MKNYFLILSSLFILKEATAQFVHVHSSSQQSMCGPIAAVCNPTSVNTGVILGVGITYFGMGQISKSSSNSSTVGYQDFTCSDSTELNQGDSYQVSAYTGQTYAEMVRVWIDFNNDGMFDSTELIFDDGLIVYVHAGIVTIPLTGQLGVPLRMRVGSEVEMYPPPDGCNDVQYGQYEDYTVYLNGPTDIPVINNINSISVSPNPFHQTTTISDRRQRQKATEKSLLKIFNSMGALVHEEDIPNVNSYILHRDDLSDGLYFFELQNENHELIGNGKFIIE